MDIITEFFKGMDRQGPGGDEQTRTALGLIRHLLPTATRAADIGCGTGRQTAVLASEPGVSVTAVDLLPEMVEGMKERMEYFDSVFPGMKSAAENVLVMQECGYVPVAHFVLPPSCWLKNYYGPMEARIAEFLAGHRGDAGAAAFTMELQEDNLPTRPLPS